jgi:hypothetical protein
MQVFKAVMPSANALREELLIACVDDQGNSIKAEVADQLLLAPAYDLGVGPAAG